MVQSSSWGQAVVPGCDWLNEVPAGLAMDSFSFHRLGIALKAHAIRTGRVVYYVGAFGSNRASALTLWKRMPKSAGLAIYEDDVSANGIGSVTGVGPDTVVCITYNSSDGTSSVSCYSEDLAYARALKRWQNRNLHSVRSRSHIYVLNYDKQHQLELSDLGHAGSPLEPRNYGTEVVADLAHVAADLESGEPCGRLILLDGPPGTGKTYLIRSLLDGVASALFVLLPAADVANSTSAEMMSILLEIKKKAASSPGTVSSSTGRPRPVVFIIEDADQCLVPRAGDNMPSISTLLNLTDGILGSTVDLRCVCSTNARAEAVDDALMRQGRLCRRLNVGPLSEEQVLDVFARVSGGASWESTGRELKPMVLANVYALGNAVRNQVVLGPKPKSVSGLGFRVAANS